MLDFDIKCHGMDRISINEASSEICYMPFMVQDDRYAFVVFRRYFVDQAYLPMLSAISSLDSIHLRLVHRQTVGSQ